MTCYVVEVLEGGSRLTFQNPSHFCMWLGGTREGPGCYIHPGNACARGGLGSTEVVRFHSVQLRLSDPLHRWQKRKISYLLKRYGHRSEEEGAVCKARGPCKNVTGVHYVASGSVEKMVKVSCRCQCENIYWCHFLSCRAPSPKARARGAARLG